MKIIRNIVKSDSDYIEFDIIEGNNDWTIGDQVRFSRDGKKMEIEVNAFDDEEVKDELTDCIWEKLVSDIEYILKKEGKFII